MVPSHSTIAQNFTYSEGLGSGFRFQGSGFWGVGVFTPYTLHPTPYTNTLDLDESRAGGISSRPLYTLHLTPSILHPTPHTLHSTPSI